MKNRLAAFVTEFVAPLLRSQGFRKSAYQWNRNRGEFIDVVTLQKASYSTEQVVFTLNLGVVVPFFLEAVWRTPFEGFATEADCAVRVRLGDLVQGKVYGAAFDQWWTISDQSCVASLGVEVTQSIGSYAMPFLESFVDYESIAVHLRKSGSWVTHSQFHIICAALAESKCGQTIEAMAKLESIKGEAWRAKIPYLQEIVRGEPSHDWRR